MDQGSGIMPLCAVVVSPSDMDSAMDYEFRRDPFSGYRARFSMGHEAIGQWLIDEVGKDEEKLDELFAIIDQLSSRARTEYRLLGATTPAADPRGSRGEGQCPQYRAGRGSRRSRLLR